MRFRVRSGHTLRTIFLDCSPIQGRRNHQQEAWPPFANARHLDPETDGLACLPFALMDLAIVLHPLPPRRLPVADRLLYLVVVRLCGINTAL